MWLPPWPPDCLSQFRLLLPPRGQHTQNNSKGDEAPKQDLAPVWIWWMISSPIFICYNVRFLPLNGSWSAVMSAWSVVIYWVVRTELFSFSISFEMCSVFESIWIKGKNISSLFMLGRERLSRKLTMTVLSYLCINVYQAGFLSHWKMNMHARWTSKYV